MIEDLVMFNIAAQEWIFVIVVLVVLLFGASKIPELARSIGKATGEFQRGKMEIQKEIDQAVKELDKTPERLKLEEAARAFGIDPTGKTDAQLKEEIKKAA
ncbi:MAG: Sec-independent protein translocase subunit TatA/TatB [Nitrososphaeria archaeon]